MNYSDDSKFNAYYEQHCKHLSLKGLRPKIIEAYARAIRRIGANFNWEIDNLTSEQLLDYFHEKRYQNGIGRRFFMVSPAAYFAPWIQTSTELRFFTSQQ